MEGFHEKAQSHYQGTTAKEISAAAGVATGAVIDLTIANINAIGNLFKPQNQNKEEDVIMQAKSTQRKSSADVSQQIGQTTQELGNTLQSAIALPVKSMRLAVEIVKLTKDFLYTKSSESFDELKDKFDRTKSNLSNTTNKFKLTLNKASGSIKNFLFDCTKGKVNITEEVQGTRAEQAKKFIDLLKTPQGQKAPHNFLNVEIKLEKTQLLEVKNGFVANNAIAEHMDSEVVQELINQNTIPAILNPNLINIAKESLTAGIVSKQQSEVVSADLVGAESIEIIQNETVETKQAELDFENELIVEKQEQLEKLASKDSG